MSVWTTQTLSFASHGSFVWPYADPVATPPTSAWGRQLYDFAEKIAELTTWIEWTQALSTAEARARVSIGDGVRQSSGPMVLLDANPNWGVRMLGAGTRDHYIYNGAVYMLIEEAVPSAYAITSGMTAAERNAAHEDGTLAFMDHVGALVDELMTYSGRAGFYPFTVAPLSGFDRSSMELGDEPGVADYFETSLVITIGE
jgi:hypothetical protein